MRFERPEALEDALQLLGQDKWKILAGGTDVFPLMGDRLHAHNVLDLTNLTALRGIEFKNEGCRIGALTTWADIASAPKLPESFLALQQAAKEVGSLQIQNKATISGNLCNASPAADGVPPLMVLDAQVELMSAKGVRLLPLSQFILGNRQIALKSDELVSAILIPSPSFLGKSHFSKLGSRRYLVISIAMLAIRLVMGEGKIRGLAISVGSCSATAQRLQNLERALLGKNLDEIQTIKWRDEYFLGINPIDDIRASAHYRKTALKPLIIRSILSAGGAA